MPFTPTIIPRTYAYRQTPTLEGSDRLFFDREIRNLGERVNELAEAVKEIQQYIVANP
jgi:hypothetical protein